MIYRTTTSGNLRNYRYNLHSSMYTLNKTMNTVITGRTFNSYKENTAAASRGFQLRSNLSQTSSQLTVSQSIVSKYEVAWSTLDTVVGDVNNAKASLTRAANDPTGSGRVALGQGLEQIARSIVEYMNASYSDNFVFAGTDGLNAPLNLSGDGTLTYRGVDVTTGDLTTLEHLATDDPKYIDLGVGLDESNLKSTTVDSSLSAIYYLGYGVEKDADGNDVTDQNGKTIPNNIVSVVYELSQILQRCDDVSGDFDETTDDEERFQVLFDKFEAVSHTLTNRYTELDATASYLKSNQALLEDRVYTLKEQISNLEHVDEADAITSYEWAQYCYDAALKVGQSVISGSLMDYLSFN